MMAMYVMLSFRVKPEATTEVLGLIEAFVTGVAEHEPDILRYESFQHADKTGFTHVIHFYDEKTRHKHLEAAHYKTFMQKLGPLCSEEPAYTNLDLVSTNE